MSSLLGVALAVLLAATDGRARLVRTREVSAVVAGALAVVLASWPG